MALSQGSYQIGMIPGLTLRAWALVKGDGTVLKQFNVASVNRSSAGSYSMNFAAAMADANCIVKCEQYVNSGGVNAMYATTVATTYANYTTTVGGSPIDALHFIAIYGA